MGKFGKKVEVSLNPLDYNITILGEGGIGKTRIAKEMCEELNVDYMHFDIGREEGASAIEGIISEKIENWEKLTEVVEDITENKEEEYPDLKVVIFDTIDELIDIAEKESIRVHNKRHPDKRADSINSAHGGFMKGQDFALNLILEVFDKLKKVGVSSIKIGHVKKTDITDVVTQETYSKLTSDVTQRYFNGIKNKEHFVALCYIDRELVKIKTNKKDKNGNTIMKNKAISESRCISFRDNTYSVDSKSRFADITDEKVPFTPQAFIKAMKDAIIAEKTKHGKSIKDAEKEQEKREEAKEKRAKENSKAIRENKINEDRNMEIVEEIQSLIQSLDDDKKSAMKEVMKKNGIKNFKDAETIPTKKLEEVLSIIQ